MILAVPARSAARAETVLAKLGESPFRAGAVVAQKTGLPPRGVPMKRLGILISGRGSNFEAIADSIAAGKVDASIAVVLGNRPERAAWKRPASAA